VAVKRLIYIDESPDLRTMIANSERLAEWKRHLQRGETLCFSVANVPDADRIPCAAALINRHQPPANTEYRKAFPFELGKGQFTERTSLVRSADKRYPRSARSRFQHSVGGIAGHGLLRRASKREPRGSMDDKTGPISSLPYCRRWDSNPHPLAGTGF
jgi:hypothetical protein